LFFGRVLGRDAQLITRKAAAIVTSATTSTTGTGAGRAAPIGITKDTYDTYKNDWTAARLTGLPVYREITLIRQNKETYGFGDMALFDLRDNNAKSPAQFYDQLIGQDVETTYVNTGDCATNPLACENTLNASTSATHQKLEAGIATLTELSARAPWGDRASSTIGGDQALSAQQGTALLDNPRIINLLITDGNNNLPNNGTWDTAVRGYAPVYIDRITAENIGGESVYKLRVAFLPPMSAPDGSDSNNDTSGELSGLRVSKLVD
jgi:hypothetical protein